MLFKLASDQVVKQSPFCGEIREILVGSEYSPNVAVAINIGKTTAHYHQTFDEVYFVLDGSIVLKLFDPASRQTTEQKLNANELCVITKGVHHQIVESSAENRLCVICAPRFDANDEHPSSQI